MNRTLLRVSLEKVKVDFNGDLDDKETRRKIRKKVNSKENKIKDSIAAIEEAIKVDDQPRIEAEQREIKQLQSAIKKLVPEKDNTIIASLVYPRSGESSIDALKPIDLESGETVTPEDPGDFLNSGLLKEEIQGETVLQIKITDRDRKSRIWTYVRKVLSGIFSGFAGKVIDNISDVVISSSAGVIASDLEERIKQSDREEISAIAISEMVKMRIDKSGDIEVLNTDDKIEYSSGVLTLQLRTPTELIIGKEKNEGQVRITKREADRPIGEISLRLVSEPFESGGHDVLA